MPKKYVNRVSEGQVGEACLKVLAQSKSGTASTAEMRAHVPSYIKLSAADRAPSPTRKGEELWEQQVRNQSSHYRVRGNIIFEGLAERVRGGLRITKAGRAFLRLRGFYPNDAYNRA